VRIRSPPEAGSGLPSWRRAQGSRDELDALDVPTAPRPAEPSADQLSQVESPCGLESARAGGPEARRRRLPAVPHFGTSAVRSRVARRGRVSTSRQVLKAFARARGGTQLTRSRWQRCRRGGSRGRSAEIDWSGCFRPRIDELRRLSTSGRTGVRGWTHSTTMQDLPPVPAGQLGRPWPAPGRTDCAPGPRSDCIGSLGLILDLASFRHTCRPGWSGAVSAYLSGSARCWPHVLDV